MNMPEKQKNIKSVMDDSQSRHILYGVIIVCVILAVATAFI